MWQIMLIGLVISSPNETHELVITSIYNNVPYNDTLTTAWGMSCLITGLEKTILFDTGGDGKTLLENMEKLNINPKDIDCVFLSHDHYDHTGGLRHLLQQNNKVDVFLLSSFTEDIKNTIKNEGAHLIEVTHQTKICEKAMTPGELGTTIKEQSLIIETDKGLIIITGCAHPGIVGIVKTVKALCDGDIYLLLGGFHLMAHSDKQIENIIEELREIGVEKIGPSHCTGERAIELFRAVYGVSFLDFGCGAQFELEFSK